MYCPFLEYRNSLCFNFLTSSDIDIFYSNKKEPVRSQQFFIKGDCDSETGLKYFLSLPKKLITFVRNMTEPVQSQQIIVKRDCGSWQVFLVSFFYPLQISFPSANGSIFLSFSCLSTVRISFNHFSVIHLLKPFSLMMLLSSQLQYQSIYVIRVILLSFLFKVFITIEYYFYIIKDKFFEAFKAKTIK